MKAMGKRQMAKGEGERGKEAESPRLRGEK